MKHVIPYLVAAAAGAALLLRPVQPPTAAASGAWSAAAPHDRGPHGRGSPAPQSMVYVAGEVARPGVYPVRPDARAKDALALAGGTRPDADLVAVNLAAHVRDGDEIVVPARGAPLPAAARSRGPGRHGAGGRRTRGPHRGQRHLRARRDEPPPAGQVDLNTADADMLATIPGSVPETSNRATVVMREPGVLIRTPHGAGRRAPRQGTGRGEPPLCGVSTRERVSFRRAVCASRRPRMRGHRSLATDLHGILMSISRKHRKFLIDKHKAEFTDKTRIKDDDDGTTRLARLLGPNGVKPYQFLNVRRPAHLFNWYEAPAGLDLATIRDRLKARHPRWLRGVEPTVTEETPPLFHTLHESGPALEIVYASDGGEHPYNDGYRSGMRQQIVLDKLLVRTTTNTAPPPTTTTTIEVSGGIRGAAHRDKLIAALAADVGVPVDQFTLRPLDTPTRWDALATEFNATKYGVAGNGRGKGLGSYAWRTKRGTPLEEQEHYKMVKGPHLDPREVEYVFFLAHADDWHEEVTYYVNYLTGQIKFPPETSEYAITRVRDAVLRIAR